MSLQMPDPGVAVDPAQVAMELRQMHAQQLDAYANEVATLRVAIRDANATIGEQRIRMEEMGNELAQLRERASAPQTLAQAVVKGDRPERQAKAAERPVNAAKA